MSLFRTTAKAIIVHGNTILLCHQVGEPIFHLPGGGIEPGELPLQALERELREEVGLPLAWASPVTELEASWSSFGKPREVVQEHMHLFAGQLRRMTPEGITQHERGLQTMWFPLAHVMPCQGPDFQVAPLSVLPYIVTVGGQMVGGGYGR